MLLGHSVVIVIDVRKSLFGAYSAWTHNGTKKYKGHFEKLLAELESLGAGEVVINSIDNDGMMNGYDTVLAEKVRNSVDIPVTMLGGAGTLSDIQDLITRFPFVGAAAGSLFV